MLGLDGEVPQKPPMLLRDDDPIPLIVRIMAGMGLPRPGEV
jgi:hypothetical protein